MAKQKPTFKNNSGIYGIQAGTKIATSTPKKPKYKHGSALSHPVK